MSTQGQFPIPPTQFAEARGGRIAYQVFGEGPNVIAVPPAAQNVEMAWEEPHIRRMLERFGSFGRFAPFDKRGTGCSDRRSHVPGLDERVDDMRAVMDAAGMDSAHLFVQSEGGPTSILFAVTYPQRVESLILFGSGAYTIPRPTDDEERQQFMDRIELFVDKWGTPESQIPDRFAPSLARDQEYRAWHQRYERNAASKDSLREVLQISMDVDVTEILPQVTVPTLVMHRTGDMIIPVELGREVARQVPGATLVEFEGDDHYAYAGDIEPWLVELEKWVTGSVSPHPPLSLTPPGVRILTLGQFGVESEGELVPTAEWGSRLARTLCKRLVAARGWPVTRDELFDLLWPEEADRTKLGARLSVQLSAVRRILGGGVIADRDTVRLDLDEISTDLEDFYNASGDMAILAAYTGEFLPEDRYEDWTMAIRDETRSRFIKAARDTATEMFERGSYMVAAQRARQIIEADRYDEDAHRLLVLALSEAGEPREAKRAHEAWTSALGELDVDVPSFDEVAVS